MNADLDEASALLAPPESVVAATARSGPAGRAPAEEHWRWRLRMAERIGGELDPERFGVQALYVFGSTKNATAGPGSDIDLLVHFDGDERQRECLTLWLDGWSRCLAEINYLRTGYRTEGLLDVHFVTDEDIACRNELRGQDRRGHRRGAAPPAREELTPRSLPALACRCPSPAQISSREAPSACSSSKRTSASSGPSCAALEHHACGRSGPARPR